MAQTSQNKKDLAQARTKTNFDITDMTNYLYGGAANVEQRRYIIDLIAREPIFNKDDWYVTTCHCYAAWLYLSWPRTKGATPESDTDIANLDCPTCRPWLNHTDAVKRGIAMSTRLAEIKMEHELNDLDFATMVEAIDDTLPVSSASTLVMREVAAQQLQLILTPFHFIMGFCLSTE